MEKVVSLIEATETTDPPPPGPGPAMALNLTSPQLPQSQPLPQPLPQLPPQMFTTAAQLLDLTDKKLMVSLRDGKKLIGVLRSWDQFANLVLQSTTERIFIPPTPGAPGLYTDIPRGIFLVRGENVLLLGEIDLDRDDDTPAGYQMADSETVCGLARELDRKRKRRERRKVELLKGEGFEGEHAGEVLL